MAKVEREGVVAMGHTSTEELTIEAPVLTSEHPDFSLKKQGQKTILLIDDDPDQLCIYGSLLRRCGYHVITAMSPLEAVQVLDYVRVNLIISDICMPGISGDELIEVLKSNGAIDSVPTILLTAGTAELADSVLDEYGPDMFCLKSDAVRLLPAQIAFLLS